MDWFSAKNLLRRVLLGGLLVACGVSPAAAQSEETAFEFAVVGDAPYSAREEREFEAMLAQINKGDFAFVIHVGDFKKSSSVCSDALFHSRRALFDRSEHPFVFLFGDNDWADCDSNTSASAGTYPEERLAKLRALFAAGDQSLGRQRLKLERQSENPRYALFRENVRWRYRGVRFVGLHVVGSDNNWGDGDTPSAEYAARNTANLAWLRDTFDLAGRERDAAVVVAMQADPYFQKPIGHKFRRGFEDVLSALAELSAEFARPVMLVHGDTHWFRVDKPMSDPRRPGKNLENLTRVETFGSPFVHWVKIRVDISLPFVFTVKEMTEP